MGIADRERAPRGEGSDPEAEQDALDAYSATVTSVAAQELPQSPVTGLWGIGQVHEEWALLS